VGEVLTGEHPNPQVPYKYFSFISDRQKGLIEAIKNVFPENHSMFCVIHIARNAERQVGKSVSKLVPALARTFSRLEAADYLSKIENISAAGRQYLDSIPKNQWLNTAWLEDPTLPKRYGIITTNMSESANSMFEEARDVSWLRSVHLILGKMCQRITDLRTKHKDKIGIVDAKNGIIEERWEKCAGYQVYELQQEDHVYLVVRQSRGGAPSFGRSYKVDISLQTCDCGIWQADGIPCIDAIAFYKLYEGKSLQFIKDNFVSRHYQYQHLRDMLRTNIVPVCIDMIRGDGETLPPQDLAKRSAGRPQKKRLRKRSRFSNNPEQSNIVCSRCKEKGHNVRTCRYREALAKKREEDETNNQDVGVHLQDLDLS
jgi:hypothetical protein